MAKNIKAVEVYKAAVGGAALEIMHKPGGKDANFSVKEYKKTVFFINLFSILITTIIGCAVIYVILVGSRPPVDTPEYLAESARVARALGLEPKDKTLENVENPGVFNAEKRIYSNPGRPE